MAKVPETSKRMLWILLLTLCGRTTLGVLNSGKTTTTTTTSTNDEVERDALQAVESNLVGYQYKAPSTNKNNNNNFKQHAPISTPNNAFYHSTPHNYSLATHPRPTEAAVTESESRYYLQPTTSMPTPTSPSSHLQFGHQLGYNYAAPSSSYHTSFSMGGFPLYQHSSPASALAVRLQGDIEKQQTLLHHAPSFFVPQQDSAVEVETAAHKTISSVLSQNLFEPLSHGCDYERPISADIDAQISLRQPLGSSTVHNFQPPNIKWPHLQVFVPQEADKGLVSATKTEHLTTATKPESTQASNHNYQPTTRITVTARPIYETPRDFESDAASAHTTKPQFNAANAYGAQTQILQKLHDSMQSESTLQWQQHISAPSQATLESFEKYLNFRLQQQQQQLQSQAQQQQTLKVNRYTFAHTAHPITKPSIQFPQTQQIISQGTESPASFPASTLEVPYTAPISNFAVQTFALPAATSASRAVPLDHPTGQPIEQQNYGISNNLNFNLVRPQNVEAQKVFLGRPNTLLSGERYAPHSVGTGSDFLQMQSESYELPTYSYYAMEAAVPSRELSIAVLNGEQPAVQLPTQTRYALDNGAMHQRHAVYGSPTLAGFGTRIQYSNYSRPVGQFQS